MVPEVGSILEGKITGITKFGAFVSLPGGKSGLVHISEIANSYVSDVHEFVELGQSVKVIVLNVSEDGKINLSIKKAAEQENNEQRSPARKAYRKEESQDTAYEQAALQENNQQFEERLKKFMQEADSRLASNPMYSDHKKRSRRR